MDFSLSKEQQELKKEIGALCANVIAPAAKDIDDRQVFPEAGIGALAGAGFFGLMVPEQYGGKGADLVTGLIALEEVAAACASTAMAASTSAWCAGKCIENYGSDAIKDKYLPGMAKGEIIGAFATTEAAGGSDLSSMVTRASKDGDSYVINGGKSYVTNGPTSDFIIVLARTVDGDKPAFSAFLVPTGSEGLKIADPIRTLGMRGALATPVKFIECKVPAENLLGEEGAGMKLALDTIDYTRLSITAIATGISVAAFKAGKQHAENREAFGKLIGKYQDIAFRVADIYVESDVDRQLMYFAGVQKQSGVKCSPIIAAAKIAATETAVRNANRAMDILAGRGCKAGSTVERIYRDAKLTEYAGGTGDILRQIIAKDLLAG